MSKCRYDLSEDCNNKDCLNCVLEKIRAEVEALNQDYCCEGDFDKCKDYVLDILDEYRGDV